MLGITDDNAQAIIAFTSIGTALVAFASIFFTARYARATVRQARENSLSDLRAYVNVDSPKIFLTAPAQPGRSPALNIELEVLNTGRTPADLLYGTVDYRMPRSTEAYNQFPGMLLFEKPKSFTSLGSGKSKTINFSRVLDTEAYDILKSDRHQSIDLRISLTYTDLFDCTISHAFEVTDVHPPLNYGTIVPLEGFFSRPEYRQINLIHPPIRKPSWVDKLVKHVLERMDWIILMIYGLLVASILPGH
jgi:hypothetical protein